MPSWATRHKAAPRTPSQQHPLRPRFAPRPDPPPSLRSSSPLRGDRESVVLVEASARLSTKHPRFDHPLQQRWCGVSRLAVLLM